MSLKTTNKQFIEENIPFGCFLWQMPDGKLVGDGEGRFLMMFGHKNDQHIRKTMEECVRGDFGISTGKCIFMPGHRAVDDEEYAEQKARMKWGLQPDPHDLIETWETLQNGRN